MTDANERNNRLVEGLVRAGLIRTPAIRDAFLAVPRHLFLPGVSLDTVYSDDAIPIKRVDGRVVSSSSQPAIMAEMLEQLAIGRGQRVLEIGTGSGYNAAIVSLLAG